MPFVDCVVCEGSAYYCDEPKLCCNRCSSTMPIIQIFLENEILRHWAADKMKHHYTADDAFSLVLRVLRKSYI